MPPCGTRPSEEILPLKTLKELLEWKEPEADIGLDVTALSLHMPPHSTHLKTLLCHDMMGGYLDDRFYNGCENKDAYRFYHWSGVDTFIYFSHNLVTIPPPVWINAAHHHGVKVLGTLITEWKDGANICQNLLADDKTILTAVGQLVKIAKYYGFEGWLVNIENEIDPNQIEGLIKFVELLTKGMKEIREGCEVIWYDSVTKEGKLLWQNELNELNRPFFDVCDGIFLNYTWTPEHLERSRTLAGDALKDKVYVGIDVFGRNFYEGGKFNTCKALEMARSYKLSVAIFAPGWTYETQDDFVCAERQLWRSLAPHLIHTGPKTLPIKTTFCQGFGHCEYVRGKVESSVPWHNLSKQQLQPLWSQEGEDTELSLVTNDAFHGGGCLGITMKKSGDVKLFVCGVSCEKTLMVEVWYKWMKDAVPFSLLLHPSSLDTSKNEIIELKVDDGSEEKNGNKREKSGEEREKSGEEESEKCCEEEKEKRGDEDNKIEEKDETSVNKGLGSGKTDTSLVITTRENGWNFKCLCVKKVEGMDLAEINVRLGAPSTILLGQLHLYTKGHQ